MKNLARLIGIIFALPVFLGVFLLFVSFRENQVSANLLAIFYLSTIIAFTTRLFTLPRNVHPDQMPKLFSRNSFYLVNVSTLFFVGFSILVFVLNKVIAGIYPPSIENFYPIGLFSFTSIFSWMSIPAFFCSPPDLTKGDSTTLPQKLTQRLLVSFLSVYLISSIFSTINSSFDSSQETILECTIRKKESSYNPTNFYTVVAQENKEGSLIKVAVLEDFFNRSNFGDSIQIVMRKGALGKKWFWEKEFYFKIIKGSIASDVLIGIFLLFLGLMPSFFYLSRGFERKFLYLIFPLLVFGGYLMFHFWL